MLYFDSKIHEGVEVRQTAKYDKVWAAADGRILGTKKWRKPFLMRCGNYQIGRAGYGPEGEAITGLVHQIIAAAWLPNPKKLPCVKHLNGQLEDNRIVNLYWASKRKIPRTKARCTSSNFHSQYVGVSKSGKTWCANITVNGHQRFLGYFAEQIDAALAYDEALVELGLKRVNCPAYRNINVVSATSTPATANQSPVRKEKSNTAVEVELR